MTPHWSWKEVNSVRWELSSLLAAIPGVRHGFVSARDSSGQPHDAGGADRSTPEQIRWRKQVSSAVVGGQREPALLHQVHGDRVLRLTSEQPPDPTPRPQADGWWALKGETLAPLAVRTADCVPLLMATQDGEALMAIHAGWRGVAAEIVPKALEQLEREQGIRPDSWLVAIGPSISGPSYEVGEEVVEGLRQAGSGPEQAWLDLSGERPHVDLRAALAGQLKKAGASAERVHLNPRCTFLDARDAFSYRRQREAAGRLIAIIGWV